jgi:hypothetical protein
MKVIDPHDILSFKVYGVKTLSMLEIYFLLGSFDISTHIFIHLVDDLEIGGLVRA